MKRRTTNDLYVYKKNIYSLIVNLSFLWKTFYFATALIWMYSFGPWTEKGRTTLQMYNIWKIFIIIVITPLTSIINLRNPRTGYTYVAYKDLRKRGKAMWLNYKVCNYCIMCWGCDKDKIIWHRYRQAYVIPKTHLYNTYALKSIYFTISIYFHNNNTAKLKHPSGCNIIKNIKYAVSQVYNANFGTTFLSTHSNQNRILQNSKWIDSVVLAVRWSVNQSEHIVSKI